MSQIDYTQSFAETPTIVCKYTSDAKKTTTTTPREHIARGGGGGGGDHTLTHLEQQIGPEDLLQYT